jgi:hypothetical protein
MVLSDQLHAASNAPNLDHIRMRFLGLLFEQRDEPVDYYFNLG